TSTLTLVNNGQPEFTTYVSVGVTGAQTAAGTARILGKYLFERMTSRYNPTAQHSYDLPNVPFTQYFRNDGSAIHGTYWHDNFGGPQSQGCVNVTWGDAAYVFQQTQPALPPGADHVDPAPPDATQVVIVN